jgi:hypothetical protein
LKLLLSRKDDYELEKIIMIWDECEWEGKLWIVNDVYELGRVIINWKG